ncbi:O-antigen ligase family protein [Metabacillus litoralis]|nr:O-antigen ligase family protein [Metabacillus litoralis]
MTTVFILANLSYSPELVEFDVLNLLILLIIVSSLLLMIKYSKNSILSNRYFQVFLFCIFTFDFFILIMEIFRGNYINSNFPYYLHINLLILILGFYTANFIKLQDLMKWFIYSALVTGILVYLEYYRGTDWINATTYVYTSKNGTAMLMLIPILMMFNFKEKFSVKFKLFYSVIFFILLIMIRSRTILFALPFCFFVYWKNTNIKLKFFLPIIVFLISLGMYDYIFPMIKNILYNNSTNVTLNTLLSGRIDHYIYFINNFSTAPLFGHGEHYLESFFIMSLYQYGIFGSLPLFLILIIPVFALKKINDIKLRSFTSMLLIVVLINAVFEGVAPFGPGIKFLFFWFVVGYVFNSKSEESHSGISKRRYI